MMEDWQIEISAQRPGIDRTIEREVDHFAQDLAPNLLDQAIRT
jgi:hypothetical protein